MERVGSDFFAVAGGETSGGFIEDDEGWGVRGADAAVGIVDAGAGVEDEVRAVDEDGAVGGVVGPDACGVGEVSDPDDVGVERAGGEGIGAGGGHVAAFVGERAVVAVGEAEGIETGDLAAIGDDVDAVSFDGGWGGDAAFGPVEVGVFVAFGDDELPEEMAVRGVEGEEDPAVAGVFRVARVLVVSADEETAVGDDG